MATCAVALDGTDAPQWKLLMPVGAFKANDGRAGWMLTDPKAVITASKLPALVDFDHGTQLKNDSRAAAWIEELKDSGPNGEPGLWGRFDWNAAGKAALAAKDYRFFSPTFLHDAARHVTKIIGGSLVNNPALDDLPALASNQETTLDLTKFAALLGLPATATADDIIAAIKALQTTTAATAAQLKSSTSLVAIAAAAGLNLAADKIGDDQVTAICTKLKAPATGDQAQVAILSGQVADLTTKLNTALLSQANKTAEETIEEGIKAGKIAPAMKAEALALCKANPDAYAAMLAKAPVILAGGRVQMDPPAEGALTDDQTALCKTMGIKPEDYKKTLAGQKENA